MKNKRGLFINKKQDKGELFLYDQIGKDWFGGIGALDFARELRDLGDVTTIDLHVNSPGGDVFEADAIYNLLVQHEATIDVMIDGLAASAASYIAMAGDSIQIAENAKFMIHNPRGGLLVFDEANVIRSEAERMGMLLDKIRDSMVILYEKRTKKKAEDLRPLLDAETWYVGQEAVDAGFADRIMPAKTVDSSFALLAKFKHVPDSLREEQRRAAAAAVDQIAAVSMVSAEGEDWPGIFRKLAAVAPYWRDQLLFQESDT